MFKAMFSVYARARVRARMYYSGGLIKGFSGDLISGFWGCFGGSPGPCSQNHQKHAKKGPKIDRKLTENPSIKSRDFMRGFSVILGVYPQNDRKPPFRPLFDPFLGCFGGFPGALFVKSPKTRLKRGQKGVEKGSKTPF